MTQATPSYGQADATFQAVGGETGVKKLVDCFYDILDTSERTQRIRAMHAPDLSISRDKLFRFLCGWMGGPKLYRETYGPIDIVNGHARFPIGQDDRDAWLWAMGQAIEQQNYPQTLAEYLLIQLTVPADRILAKQQSQQQSEQ